MPHVRYTIRLMSNPSRISSASIKQEVKLLKSFIIGIAGKDKEGDYRPEFVQRILRASREKPKHTFSDAKEFLEKLDTFV